MITYVLNLQYKCNKYFYHKLMEGVVLDINYFDIETLLDTATEQVKEIKEYDSKQLEWAYIQGCLDTMALKLKESKK